MGIDRPLMPRSKRAFHDRVQPHRHLQARAFFDRMAQFVGRRQILVRIIVLRALAGLPACDLRAQQPVSGIAARHQRRVRVAAFDPRAGLAEQRLLQHPDAREHRHCLLRADCMGDRTGRISIRPPPARDRDGLNSGQRRGHAAIVAGSGDRFEHEIQRLQCALEIFFVPHRRSYADEDRRALNRSHRWPLSGRASGGSALAIARSSAFWILPLALRGSGSRPTITRAGTL